MSYMRLNYHAFPRRSGNFLFHADSDEEAKAIVSEHLRDRGDDFTASIYRWSQEKGDWDFDSPDKIEVCLPEPKLPQTAEFKLEIRYVKYVQVTGTMTEDKFYNAAKAAASKLLDLPSHEGWKTYDSCESTFCSDDERYHADRVETINLGEAGNV